MTQYVALLRGINVGGNHLIKMKALRSCFEGQGLTDVATYIQSGNDLFKSSKKVINLIGLLDSALGEQFVSRAVVVVLAVDQLRDVVRLAPPEFGATPVRYRYDVIFLRDLEATTVLERVPRNPAVDTIH